MQVAWAGPVSAAQVGATSLPGDRVGFLACKGDGTPSCGQLSDSWPSAKVAALLAAAGLDPSDPSDVVLRAFSAGGSTLKRVLLGADAARVRAVVLSDATYTDWASPGNPTPPEGFVQFGLEALVGSKLLVATASSAPNGKMPNGSQTLEALKNEIERRSGIAIPDGGSISGVPVQPVRMWSTPSLLLADYGNLITHSQHATILAAPIWQNVAVPWLTGKTFQPGPDAPAGPRLPPQMGEPLPGWVLALIAASAVSAGFVATRAIARKM